MSTPHHNTAYANFRAVVDASPIPYALNDGQKNIIYLNEAFIKNFGYSLQDIPNLAAWWPLAYPDEDYRHWVSVAWQARLDKVMSEGGEFEPLEVNICCKDGCVRTVLASAGMLEDTSDIHLVTLYDITERKQAEEALRKSEARFRAIVHSAPVPIGMNDEHLNVTLINPAFTKAYGYTLEDLPTVFDWWQKAFPDEVYRKQVADVWLQHVEQAQQQGFFKPVEGYVHCKDGSIRNVHSIAEMMSSGETVVINLDITEQKVAEAAQQRMESALKIANLELSQRLQEVESLQAALREQALRDPLTNLYNRRYLNEVILHELARAEREQMPLSIIIADVDHFKRINDQYGHKSGDTCLVEIANCLSKHTRSSDIVCRYGGEEFLMIFPNATSHAALERVEALRQQCSKMRVSLTDEPPLQLSLSFGVASYPEHGRKVCELFDRADQALYISKNQGRNRVTVWESLQG